jgi:hypothetical protein
MANPKRTLGSVFLVIFLFGCQPKGNNNDSDQTIDPSKGPPQGELSDGTWILFTDPLQNLYFAYSNIKFSGYGNEGRVSLYETTRDSDTPACQTMGTWKLDYIKGKLVISMENNSNCPWMSKLSGSYTYKYDISEYGRSYNFSNGRIKIAKAAK